MRKKVIGILIVGLLILTAFPTVSASVYETDDKENEIVYESSLFGVGFVRIHGFTHTIKGFVIFGINDGQVITTEFINIKYNEVNKIFAGYLSPLVFFFRYNPI
jgi:hypothetical protein